MIAVHYAAERRSIMIYQLTTKAQETEKNKFKKCLPWLSFTFLPMLICPFYSNWEFDMFLFGICCMFCFLGYYAIRSATNMRLTMRISLDGDRITFQADGQPNRTINRNEIKKVIEIPNEGLQLSSINSSQVITIPIDIEGFQTLKSELATWVLPIKHNKTKITFYLTGIYGTLAIVIAAILLKSRFLLGFSLAIVIIFFIYSFIQRIRSPKGILKWVPIIVPLLIVLIVFILIKFIK